MAGCVAGTDVLTPLLLCVCSEGGGSGTVSEHTDEFSQPHSSIKVKHAHSFVNLESGYLAVR